MGLVRRSMELVVMGKSTETDIVRTAEASHLLHLARFLNYPTRRVERGLRGRRGAGVGVGVVVVVVVGLLEMGMGMGMRVLLYFHHSREGRTGRISRGIFEGLVRVVLMGMRV